MSQSGGDGMKLESGSEGDGGEEKGKGLTAEDLADEFPVWSSIRGPSSSDDEDGDAEIKAMTGFDSLAELENSFPMERRLFLAGRTKSYHNLPFLPLKYEDMLLKEHPSTKRRRLISAYLHARKTCSANVGPALPSDDDQKNEEATDDVEEEEKTASDGDK